MKKWISILLTFVLCFNFPVIAFAQTPTEPNLEGLSNSEAAAAVEQYNQSVAEYNKQIDSDYESAVQKYNETNAYNEQAAAHNAQEQTKIDEVNAYNEQEQARVDAINQKLEFDYNEQLAVYNDKMVQEEMPAPRYVQEVNGKETLYYDSEGNLVLKSVAGNNAKDDIVTYENMGTNESPVWSSTYNYNGNNKRYVNFSLISTIGKTTTGTDWDNDASKYSNKVFATIANLNDVSAVPLNFKDEGEGRNLINYKTAEMGLELCDSMIRTIANSPISTYFNASNGNEATNKPEAQISFKDFPTNAEVFTSLQTNGSSFYDPDTGQKITGLDINSVDYNICWFSVKYQSNGWRVSGVLLKNGVLVPPAEPTYEVANLKAYVPQYMELLEALEVPIKGTYLDFITFVPREEEPAAVATVEIVVPMTQVTQPLQAAVETPAPEVTAAVATFPVLLDNEAYDDSATTRATPVYIGDRGTPAAESIEDDATPLAAGITESNSWALVNLILMIVNILVLLIVPRKKNDEEEEKKYRSNALGVILAIAAVVLFIFTQNVYLPMVLVDKWTILMAAFAGGGILTKVFGYKKANN